MKSVHASQSRFTGVDLFRRGLLAVAIVGMCCLPRFAAAATVTWRGTVDGAWNTSTANWAGGSTTFTDGDTVTFDDTATGTTGITIGTAVSPAGTITISNTTKNYSFSGASGISGTAKLTKTGVGSLTFSNSSNYFNTTTLRGGTTTFLGNVVVTTSNATTTDKGFVLSSSSGDNATLQIQDNATFSSNGSFELANASTAAATVLMSGGTLTSTYSTGTLGSTVRLGNTGTATWNQTGGLATFNNQQVTLGAYGGQGQVSISSGTFRITGTSGSSLLNVGSKGNGTLTISGNGVVDTGTSGGLTIIISSGTTTASGVVNLDGGTLRSTLVRMGLAGATSTFNFNGGTLVALTSTSSYMQGLTSAYVKSGGAVIDTNGYGITIAQPLLDGTGGGGLTKLGSGTLTLSGSNTYTGATTISAGALNLGSPNAIGSTGTVSFGGGNLQYSASNTTDYSSRFSSAANQAYSIDTNSQAVTLASGLSSSGGTLTKLGSGTLTLSASNSFTGGARAVAGTLVVGDASALAASTVDMNVADSGSLTFSQNSTLGGLTGSRDVDMGTRTVSIGNNGQSTTYSGVLSNGSLTKLGSGTLTLSGSNIYAGATTISAGALQVGNAGTTGSLGTGDVTNSAALLFNRSNAITVSNAISGSGSLTNLGSGTLTLTGTNTYAGATTISAGALQVGNAGTTGSLGAGNVVNNAALLFNRSDATAVSNVISGSGSLTKLGAGTLSLQAVSTYTGNTTVSSGTLLLAGGGAINSGSNAWLYVSRNAGDTGALVIQDGASISTGQALIGENAGSFGTVTMTGGTLSAVSAGNQFRIGSSGTGVWNQSGGLVNLTGSLQASLGRATAGSYGEMTISSGTFRVSAAMNVGSVGTGVLTISGNGFVDAGYNNSLNLVNSSGSSTGVGIVNLDGGTLRAKIVQTGFPTATSTFNFNGGKLVALTSTSTYLQGLTSANVKSGGAVVDSNGYDITIAQSLLNGGGGGGLSKLGSGTLTLSGSNGYTGTTAVNAGTLRAGHVNAFGTGTASLAGGATLDMNSLAVSNAITNNGGTISNAASYAGTQTLNGASIFGGLGGTLVVASGGTATFGGALAAATTINAGGRGILNDAGSISAASLTNNGTFTIDRTGSSSLSTAFSGSGTLVKAGAGVVTLAGTSGFSGSTQVNAGALRVNGSLAGGVDVAASSTLGGSGSVGAISGAGLVGPGNSPGILTATSADPAGGLAFAFELTAAAPNYSNPTSSDNDLLWLTGGTPFTTSLTGSNTVNIYFTAAAVELGTLTGGFFTTNASDFLSMISGANFQYFVQSNSGSTSYNGATYQTLSQYDAGKSVTISTVAANGGQVMQMVVVPEPAGIVIAGVGVILAGWAAARRAGLCRR